MNEDAAFVLIIVLVLLLALFFLWLILMIVFGTLLFAGFVSFVSLPFASIASVFHVTGEVIQQVGRTPDGRPRNLFSFSSVDSRTYTCQSRSPDLAAARVSTDSDSSDADSTDSSDSSSTDTETSTNSNSDSSGSYVISSSEQLASVHSRIQFGGKVLTQEHYSAWSSRRGSRRCSWPQAPIAITLDTNGNGTTQAPLHNHNLRSRTSL